jgi:hypothetical protein
MDCEGGGVRGVAQKAQATQFTANVLPIIWSFRRPGTQAAAQLLVSSTLERLRPLAEGDGRTFRCGRSSIKRQGLKTPFHIRRRFEERALKARPHLHSA